jgi:short-subunit dehydrogenase
MNNNKNCFISGATGGLGQCLAKEFAKKKYNLFLTSTSESSLKKLKKELISTHKNIDIFYEAGNFTSLTDLKRITNNAIKKFKILHILINNAGTFPVQDLKDTSLQDFQECFDVNVRAPFYFSKIFSEGMKDVKWGRIVNIASSSAYEGYKKTSIYCASKHALLGFTRSILHELKEYNIRSYSISPGSIQTKMGKKVPNQNYDTFIDPKEISKFISMIVSFDKQMISEEVKINRFNL